MKEKTKFIVDKSTCILGGCCIHVCSDMVIALGSDGYLKTKEFEHYSQLLKGGNGSC